jgi:hypothetical protein
MDAIEGKLYSPFLKTTLRPVFKPGSKLVYETHQSWERPGATVNKIRVGDGYPVSTFRQLIDEVALVTLSNKKFEMFYRGQTKDYKDSQSVFYKGKSPKTIIYPSICRPERKGDGSYKHSIRKAHIKNRYDELYDMIDMISGKRTYHPEYYFALLQHYDILPTPLIDITQSLRVAATFALRNSKKGYVYVFGLPYPNQSISHYTDMGIVLVKLQNVCPVTALRPRYQEGYLVGKYPFQRTKEGGDNLARRLVAKFRLENDSRNFWDEDFLPMPEDVLYPKDDKVEVRLIKEKEKFLKNYRS